MEHGSAVHKPIHKPIARRFASGALLLVLIAACRPADEPGPPPEFNVVLISVDTLRADRLNCYGYERRKVSPNIDALAADGILFENYISATSWTTPAHLTMFTSLYPSAHGVIQTIEELQASLREGANFNRLPESRVTLAEALKDGGYATGAFTGGGTMDPRIGFDQGFDRYDTAMHKLTSFNMRDMYEWIDGHAQAPFFLLWHNFEVHAPYLKGTFLDEVLPPDTAAAAREFLHEVDRRRKYHSPNAAEHKNTVERAKSFLRENEAFNAEVCGALYDGGIDSMDTWLGKFILRMRRQGLYDNTLIILTSDHGEEFGEHCAQCLYQNHGHSVYEEMVHVPLIIKLPHQPFAGTRVSSAVRMIDLMPTILDVLDVKKRPKDMQGLSLRPLWEQPETQEDRLAISEAMANMREKKGVRTGRYKFIYTLEPDTVAQYGRSYIPEQLENAELYDLRTDPAEQTNLLESSPSREITELGATLEKRLREFVAGDQGQADTIELDEDTLQNLRALGYIE